MTKTQYFDEEDKPLLVLGLDSEKIWISQPVCEAAITRGAVNYLGRWPAHVLAAFITGCLVFASFVLFGIMTAILTVPLGEKCRLPRNIEANYLPNLYFVKHENRTWSQKELCYIETTARTYKNLSVYLINLLDDNETRGNLSKTSIELFEPEDKSDGYAEPISVKIFDENVDTTRQKSPEKQSRENLSSFNSNIKNIDVPIRRFFNGSRLAKISNHLNEDILEMAAKAYVLWNFPGVALDPEMFEDIKFFQKYLYKNVDDENGCGKDSEATIELNGDIQASFVPCQAFLDHLIRQISINESADNRYTLKKAISDFCPSSSRCQGVKLFNRIPNIEIFKEKKLNCPTIILPHPNEVEKDLERTKNALKELNEIILP